MPQWIVKIQKNKKQKTVATVGILLLSVFCFAFFLFGFVDYANANGIAVNNTTNTVQEGLDMIEEPLGLPSTDIRTIIANIIRVALSLVGLILVVLISYGGFLYMTSGGNEEQITRAKKILKNAVIGLAIILSAYSIVLFIMKMLGIEGGLPIKQTISLDGYQNFRGSGALGRIVKDHYPERNQKDVYRNTKIVVTFRKPVLASSFIEDKNEDGIFGNCTSTTGVIDFETDCDTLKTDAIVVEAISGTEELPFLDPTKIAVLVQPTTSTIGNYGVHTIVIRPLTYLGSSLEEVEYKVKLTNKILLDDVVNDNPSAFSYAPGYYEWKFTCGTEIDLTPPYIKSTWPRNLTKSAKNTVIQIEFNEAIDPTGLQGMFEINSTPVGDTLSEDGKTYFELSGNNIYLKNGDELLPVGNMNLTGGYKILEFTPTVPCGTNACGGQVFCLPVATSTAESKYELVLKAGFTSRDDSWEADAFTGVMDMASNALDGNHDNKIQHATTVKPVFNKWQVPDNYNFSFVLKNKVDLTPPYINKIYPGLDGENVTAKQDWGFLFSKRMRVAPLYDIGIVEHPDPILEESNAEGQCAILKQKLDDFNLETGANIDTDFECVHEYLWKVPKINFISGQTEVMMNHGKFLDKMRQYYFPYATSTIEDVNFNCFYPGKGPGKSSQVEVTGKFVPVCDTAWTGQGCLHLDESELCDSANPDNCTGVEESSALKFGCNGVVGGEINEFGKCRDELISDSNVGGDIDPPAEGEGSGGSGSEPPESV